MPLGSLILRASVSHNMKEWTPSLGPKYINAVSAPIARSIMDPWVDISNAVSSAN